jgi:hypothetical protein
MQLEFARDVRTAIRSPVAMFTAACGAATAVGSFLTWLSARGARPSIGMRHTSLAQMLVYTFANADPFWKSVGGAVLVLGAAMVFGALAGLRTLAILAALLALVAGGMWIGLVVHPPARQAGWLAHSGSAADRLARRIHEKLHRCLSSWMPPPERRKWARGVPRAHLAPILGAAG